MADIWQQFHSLPKTIRDGVATPEVIAAIDDLETRYSGVDLANLIMRVVVHEFPITELKNKLTAENTIDDKGVETIVNQLRQVVFTGVIADYLGIPPASATPTQPLTVPPAPPKNVPPANLPVPPPKTQAVPLKAEPVVEPPIPPVLPVPPVPVSTTSTMPVPPPTVPELLPISPIGRIAPTTQYSDEDMAEIDRQATRLKKMASVGGNQDLDGISRAILTEQNVAFSDELLDRRAVAIVKARLKDIRSTDDTTAMLSREPKVGGLGLDHEIALQLSAAADRYAQELKARGMIRPAAPIALPTVPRVIQAMPDTISSLPPERLPSVPMVPTIPSPPVPMTSVVVTAPTLPPTPPAVPTVPPPALPANAPVVLTEPPPLPTPPAPVSPVAAPIMQGQRMTDRPTMADITRPAVALGPADEIRSMTLIEFRRLGQGAGDSARKLLEKFDHLKRESFAVWAEAVASWRQSNVYLLYLDIGRESLERGVPISQIIADRGRAGKPYLSEHEFTVLSDLNRHLQM